MSYLTLPRGVPSFDKAVISLWFRVPVASLDAKRAAAAAAPGDALMRFVLPLLTWGAPLTKHLQETVFTNVANPVAWPPEAGPDPVFMSPTGFAIVGEAAIEPSYIGLDCSGPGFARLVVNLQMTGRSAMTHIGDQVSQIDYYSSFVPPSPPAGYDPSPGTGWAAITLGHTQTISVVDVSAARNAQPEYFHVSSGVNLLPDHWHHLLLSVDLSADCITHGPPQLHDPDGTRHATTSEGTDSACHLWYAVDDIDQRGSDAALGPYYVDGGDGNEILTPNAWGVANDVTGLISNLWSAPSSCTYAAETLPSEGDDLGVPAASAWVDDIYPVEMSELQIFTGVSLDTADPSRRRAFVSEEGRPVNPQNAEALLGRKPDVLLHGSGNWARGINTGPPYVPNPESGGPETIPDPAEALTPTGMIAAYRPDPSLHGDQGTSPSLLMRSPGR